MSSVIEQFQAQISHAVAQGQKLRIQGGNSKHFYGTATHSDAVLDTRAHSGIVSYEPSELVVTVRCGTPLAELEAVLAEQGQCLAFEPPHFATDGQSHATVGGMVACGLAGPARAVGCDSWSCAANPALDPDPCGNRQPCLGTPPPPAGNVPPAYGQDPHGVGGGTAEIRRIVSTYVRTGVLPTGCSGKPCGIGGWTPAP